MDIFFYHDYFSKRSPREVRKNKSFYFSEKYGENDPGVYQNTRIFCKTWEEKPQNKNVKKLQNMNEKSKY